MTTSPTTPDTTKRRPPENPGDEMLTLQEACDFLRIPEGTLRYWRHLGAGPRSFKIGRTSATGAPTSSSGSPSRPTVPRDGADRRQPADPRGRMSHGQHREAHSRPADDLAGPLPHACRGAAQQDVLPQDRRRAVP